LGVGGNLTPGRVGDMVVAHPCQPFDLEDLLAAPDDGYRYEVLDGALVVNAAPSWRHQQIVARLLRLLEDAAPEGQVALPSPVWRIGAGQIPEPDLLVASTDALGDHAVEGTPELVVEILSPSNRGSDLVRKRGLYADAGCGSYWIVDPAVPSVVELALEAGAYVERACVSGTDRFVSDRPFQIGFRPADL
jgi:Uma2 family endonuclease